MERIIDGIAFVKIRDSGQGVLAKKNARGWAGSYRRKGVRSRVIKDTRGYYSVWVEKSKRSRC